MADVVNTTRLHEFLEDIDCRPQVRISGAQPGRRWGLREILKRLPSSRYDPPADVRSALDPR